MSLQTKTMCCQCDYHSYVNDLGETKNMKKEINIWELCKKKKKKKDFLDNRVI